MTEPTTANERYLIEEIHRERAAREKAEAELGEARSDAAKLPMARQQRDEARALALREAAQIADDCVSMGTSHWAWKAARVIAERIRALASPSSLPAQPGVKP